MRSNHFFHSKKVLSHSSRADRIARNYLFSMEHECHRTDRKLRILPSTRLTARITSTHIEQSHSLQFPKFIRKRDFIHASCVRALSFSHYPLNDNGTDTSRIFYTPQWIRRYRRRRIWPSLLWNCVLWNRFLLLQANVMLRFSRQMAENA